MVMGSHRYHSSTCRIFVGIHFLLWNVYIRDVKYISLIHWLMWMNNVWKRFSLYLSALSSPFIFSSVLYFATNLYSAWRIYVNFLWKRDEMRHNTTVKKKNKSLIQRPWDEFGVQYVVWSYFSSVFYKIFGYRIELVWIVYVRLNESGIILLFFAFVSPAIAVKKLSSIRTILECRSVKDIFKVYHWPVPILYSWKVLMDVANLCGNNLQ